VVLSARIAEGMGEWWVYEAQESIFSVEIEGGTKVEMRVSWSLSCIWSWLGPSSAIAMVVMYCVMFPHGLSR
jgi:hypothetical protein